MHADKNIIWRREIPKNGFEPSYVLSQLSISETNLGACAAQMKMNQPWQKTQRRIGRLLSDQQGSTKAGHTSRPDHVNFHVRLRQKTSHWKSCVFPSPKHTLLPHKFSMLTMNGTFQKAFLHLVINQQRKVNCSLLFAIADVFAAHRGAKYGMRRGGGGRGGFWEKDNELLRNDFELIIMPDS